MPTYYSSQYESTYGTNITAAEALYMPQGGLNGERALIAGGQVRALALTTDLVRMIRNVPSNARIWFMWASADDASAAGAFHIGVHMTEPNGGAVVDADCFATALAKNVNTEVLNEAGTPLTVRFRGRLLWELLNLSADSKTQYDITITPSTSFTTTPIGISLFIIYTLG